LTPAKAISEDSVELVLRFILDNFPSDADGLRASLGYQILFHLSHSLSRLPYPSGQRPVHFDSHRHDIGAAPALLEDLSKLLREGYLDVAEAEGKTNKKKNRQRGKTQQLKVKSVAHGEINDRLFQAGREAPRNRQSAEELVQSIITTQKNALKVRLPQRHFPIDL